MTPAPRVALVAAFAAVYLIWGSTYLAIDRGVAEIPPFLMAGIRFLSGGARVFVAWAAHRGRRTTDRARLGGDGAHRPADGGGRQRPGELGAHAPAVRDGRPARGGWCRSGWRSPTGCGRTGARPPARVIAGLVLGFAGVALLVDPAAIGGVGGLDPIGAGTVVVASLLWAAGSVYSRYAPQPSSQALSSGMQMLGGAAALACLSLASGELAGHDWRSVSATAFGAWAYVAVFGSVAYGSYLWLLKGLDTRQGGHLRVRQPGDRARAGLLRGERDADAVVAGLFGPRAGGRAPGRFPVTA